MKFDTFKKVWRPVGASISLLLIFARYAGLIDPGLEKEVELAILEIMKWLIGLYAVSRGGEKIAAIVKPTPDRG